MDRVEKNGSGLRTINDLETGKGMAMFQQHFLNYLVEKKEISGEQRSFIQKEQQNARVKLGLIAIAEKLMNSRQTEELNDLQRRTDRRFGDLAIEKGYLTEEQLNRLLKKQGNPFLQLVQILTDHELFSMEQIEQHLNAYRSAYRFSRAELEILKSGEVDSIIPLFVKTDKAPAGDYLALAIRNVIRFIHNQPLVQQVQTGTEYEADNLAYQELTGGHHLWLGFAGPESSLLEIASPFARETFTQVDEDAFDAVCEFINCINGLFATEQSHSNVKLEIMPPHCSRQQTLKAAGGFYLVPLVLNGQSIDLIAVVDGPVDLI